MTDKKYKYGLCYCDNCKNSFAMPVEGSLEDFVNELSVNGCIYCTVAAGESPKIFVLKFISEQEETARELVEDGMTKYCEFDKETEICEELTPDQEWYNSVCKFVTF